MGRACQGRGTLPWLTSQASLGTVCSPGGEGPCPPHLSSLPQQALQGIRCSQSQGLDGDRRGPTQSCRVAPRPTLHLPLWCACACVSVYRWPSACWCRRSRRLHGCACQEPSEVLRACEAVCPVCHVCPDLTRCHSQYNAVKEQCGPLFLSERKNEQLVCLRLVAPQKGWVLLGTHPPACTASHRVQHHTAPSQDLWPHVPGVAGPVWSLLAVL